MEFIDLFKQSLTLYWDSVSVQYVPAEDRKTRVSIAPHHFDGICWGGRVWGKSLPQQSATKNYCFVGTVGSGKTVSIKLLLQTVLPFITYEEFDHRALVYDPKQEMIPFLLGLNQYLRELEEEDAKAEDRPLQDIKPIEVKTLNPFDVNGYAWDMARDVTGGGGGGGGGTSLSPPE